jgi:hypothetical protein
MEFAAFDLEIAKELPENADWKEYAPLGITCAAVAFDNQETLVWHGVPRLSKEKAQGMVGDLQRLVNDGYTLLTWNGCSFDFGVLAYETEMWEECSELAMSHIDMMLIVTFSKGHYLSLEKALMGAKLGGKVKSVVLSDGATLNDMGGEKAPTLWAKGEYEVVLNYLRGDVTQTLKLAHFVQNERIIRWTSNNGNPQSLSVKKLLKVKDCFDIPGPDTSWMRNPPSREKFTSWMKYGLS